MKQLLLSFGLCFLSIWGWTQGSAFGVKGGATVGIQRWNGLDQGALLKYHGIAYIETLDVEDNLFSIFAQAGYHIKGSALRNTRFTLNNGNIFNLPAQEFQFRNVSLTIGGKKKFAVGSNRDNRAYYLLGIRGEYTINTNLNEYQEANNVFSNFFPSDNWVRRFNYGATVGGGFEFPFSDLVGGIVEFTVNPDLSRQYWQPALENVPDPYNPGNNRTIGERQIYNVTLEISLGIRLLRVVEYID